MASGTLATSTKPSVFAISCWVLCLVAFSELLIGGMALATRFEESRQTRIVTKEVTKIVTIRVPATEASDREPDPVVSRPPVAAATGFGTASPVPAIPPTDPPPSPMPINTPKIADPQTERLVKEARQARVASDMGVAVMKLEEAVIRSPDDPNVHYELGLVHEQMGVYDIAGSHYQRVYDMGVSGAGSLYSLAAQKFIEGVGQPDEMLGKMSLGRVRIFKDPNDDEGQRVILTIPVQKAPGEDIDIGEMAVAVSFFNRGSKGEIVQLEDKSWVTEKWVTMPFDWAGGEESLRMTYVIPVQDEQTEHLFGSRTYYGQVVSLTYKGEVLDVQAWPRDLAAKIPAQPAAGNSAAPVLPEFQDSFPPDYDPNLPLLPPK